MKLFISCPKGRSVWLGVKTGNWEPGLREHAEHCPDCLEVALVTSALATSAKDTSEQDRLPDPRMLWWRAQWRRAGVVERATRPIVLYRRFAGVTAFVLLGAAGALLWPWLVQWLPAWEGQWRVFGLAVPLIGLPAVAGIGCLLAYRALFGEE